MSKSPTSEYFVSQSQKKAPFHLFRRDLYFVTQSQVRDQEEHALGETLSELGYRKRRGWRRIVPGSDIDPVLMNRPVQASLLLVFLCPSLAISREAISYRLSYSMDGSGRVDITVELPKPAPGPRILVVPRAVPMGYGEQPYDRFVKQIQAYAADGRVLPVARQRGPRWKVGEDGMSVGRIEYAVDVAGMERDILAAADTSKLRPGYLSLLGYSVFAYVEGLEGWPAALEIRVPRDWPVLTTLAPQSPPPKGRTSGRATDFYALADSQVVAGPELSVSRLECTVPLYLALYAEGEVTRELMGRLAEEAMKAVVDYFGGAPFEHYTVLQELLRPASKHHRYGFSMEHLDSGTFSLALGRGLTESSKPEELARTRYNFAHHFAHAWIPKRAYGKGYFPFRWELAPLLDSIWFSEGFAQFAAIEAIADGLPEPVGRRYRETMLAERFRRTLDRAPLFIQQMSLVELSRVASTRYSEDFRTGRNVFSRGGLMAAEMDALIREKSKGAKRLRDGLRHLVNWSKSHRRAFEIDEIPAIFLEATGVDTREVLERWLAPLSN
ncbi:MAG: hypothetical protein ACE5JI_11320 [Acidobacteriota bacterium]